MRWRYRCCYVLLANHVEMLELIWRRSAGPQSEGAKHPEQHTLAESILLPSRRLSVCLVVASLLLESVRLPAQRQHRLLLLRQLQVELLLREVQEGGLLVALATLGGDAVLLGADLGKREEGETRGPETGFQ